MQQPAVFFDRDGTLNYDPGYLNDPSKVKLYPGVPQKIKQLKEELNFKAIVISNQSGIARGLITLEQLNSVNNKINFILSQYGTGIDKFYYCPYHPDFNPQELCKCRKPSPQMVFQAAQDFDIDLSKSYFVGDSIKDVECGKNAGVKTILVKTSLKEDDLIPLKKAENYPNFVADNFNDACDFIINDFTGGIN